jgi:hypothetical protein
MDARLTVQRYNEEYGHMEIVPPAAFLDAKWAKNLVHYRARSCQWSWALCDDGIIILLDTCGNWCAPPSQEKLEAALELK